MNTTILEWKSKVQIHKGTPSISLIKHLVHQAGLQRGKEITCKLIMEKKKLFVLIDLDNF